MAKHKPLRAVNLPAHWTLQRTEENMWQAKYKDRFIAQRTSLAAAVVFIYSYKLTSEEMANATLIHELMHDTAIEGQHNG